MNAYATAPPAYSRLSAEFATRHPRAAAKATKAQSVVELGLFAIFGVSILLSAIALYAMYSPDHKMVPNRVADGLKSGRVNVLIIGTSTGASNRVATESLTVLSMRPGTPQAAMISLPRDLWVRVGHYGSHRLGSAWAIGESSGYPGEGAGLVSDTVENIIGQPVHAYMRVDAANLRQTIDALGGVDVFVQHPFHERAKHDTFRPGWTHLDGQRAIRFAQSTQVLGPQGARHARELRQQQVVAAVMQKLAKASPDVRARLASAGLVGGANASNLSQQQLDLIASQLASAAVRNVTIDPLVKEFEVRSFFDGGEAVKPLTGDYAKVQELARNVFAGAQPIAAVH